ncbi:MAG: hypothetical protein HQK55_01145 [Deltaproteobacteria bacterium]|nr:hypothetical protein [Deltaproteobacteria bacterium]
MDYEQNFKLKSAPFQQTADPSFYYADRTHEQLLESILSLLASGEPVVQVVGDLGTGKTLLIRVLEGKITGDWRVAVVLNPYLTPQELVRALVKQWRLGSLPLEGPTPDNLSAGLIMKMKFDRREGQNYLLVIDDAQALSALTRDFVQELAALAASEKLFKLAVFSNNELDWLFSGSAAGQADQPKPPLKLSALSAGETVEYIQHRLEVAGRRDREAISAIVLNRIHEASGGRPKFINLIAERTLMAATIAGEKTADLSHFQKAMASLKNDLPPVRTISFINTQAIKKNKSALVAVACILLICGIAIYWWMRPASQSKPEDTSISSTIPQTGLSNWFKNDPGAALGTAPTMVGPLRNQESLAKSPPAGSDLSKQTSPGPSSEALSQKPVPPPEVVVLPMGHQVVTIDRQTGAGRLWSGGDRQAVLKMDFKTTPTTSSGLYILGVTLKKNSFVFAYPLADKERIKPGPELWSLVGERGFAGVLPVVITAADNQTDSGRVQKVKEIKKLVAEWDSAWRGKNIDRLVQLHGEPFTYVADGGNKIKTYVKKTLQTWIKQTIDRNGPLSSSLSDVVCLINPEQPSQAAAVFNYKLQRGTQSDDGSVVLIFKLVTTSSGREEWKIVAELWVPEG